MNSADSSFDEYTLAAFMAGSLSDDRRQEVITYLAENAEARELLAMAYQALDASTDETPLPFEVPAIPQATPQPVKPAPARAPRVQDRGPRVQERTARRFSWKQMSRYAGVFVVVFALGLSLRLVLGPPAQEDDPLTVRDGTAEMSLNPTVEQDLIFRWNAVQGADRYTVTVFDNESEIIATYETKSNRINSSDSFLQELKPKLTADETYTLRIDAWTLENRRMEEVTNTMVAFTLPQ